MPATPAATRAIARPPRMTSGSGKESASPGFSLSIAPCTPFFFGRWRTFAGAVVVGGVVVVAGGTTAWLVVVGGAAWGVVGAGSVLAGADVVAAGGGACACWSARRMSSRALE